MSKGYVLSKGDFFVTGSEKKQRRMCSFLILLMIGISCFEFISTFRTDKRAFASNISLTSLDENTTKIHYNNPTTVNKDIILKKAKVQNGYHYSMYDAEKNEQICVFNSERDIKLDNNMIFENKKMCAAATCLVRAIMKNEDPASAVTALFGTAAATFSNKDIQAIVDLVAESGIAAIPAVMGLLSTSELVVAMIGVGSIA